MAKTCHLLPTQLCHTFDFGCLSQVLADVTISHETRTHTHTHTVTESPALPVTTYINKQWRTDRRIEGGEKERGGGGGKAAAAVTAQAAQPDTSLSLSNQGHFICTHSHRSVKHEAHSTRAVQVKFREKEDDFKDCLSPSKLIEKK